MPFEHRIEPGRGVGPLTFGLTTAAVRALLGEPDWWKRNGGGAGETWGYDDRGLVVHFDRSEALAGIEIVRGVGIRAMLGKRNLLGTSGAAAVAAVEAEAPDGVADEHAFAFTAPSAGLRLGREHGDRARWDTVRVVRPGSPMAVGDAPGTELQSEPRPPAPPPRWEVVPGLRVGPVHRGMSREEVDAALGQPEHVFGTRQTVRVAYDHILVVFDPRGHVLAAEVFDREHAVLTIDGIELVAPDTELAARLHGAGHGVSEDGLLDLTIDGKVILAPGAGGEVGRISIDLR